MAQAVVPPALQAPEEQTLLVRLQGKGSQIYLCQHAADGYAWKLQAPDAQLFDQNGKLMGHHFAGPTWEAADGSQVSGKLAASVPSPDGASIPWLLLTVTSHKGTGLMSRVESVQRLETHGGLAPAASCDVANVGKSKAVPYEAGYYFYGPSRPNEDVR